VKLFSHYSNCDHDTSTLHTDRRTDGQSGAQLAMAIPRSATLRAVKTKVLQINFGRASLNSFTGIIY